ncbi:hypothetical protein H131_11033 [Lysinibacillus sphaericus OT4b.31]|uniref:Uncharacterized protein n=1 Tax=Lysinibacillus sphaericus OT4b.31 TaxID=1285586 RepID=R7ZEV4_LYSSH|nr:hypothetical protein H131_11033 [Lysinibacillus sphaericus OT4b.31]
MLYRKANVVNSQKGDKFNVWGMKCNVYTRLVFRAMLDGQYQRQSRKTWRPLLMIAARKMETTNTSTKQNRTEQNRTEQNSKQGILYRRMNY